MLPVRVHDLCHKLFGLWPHAGDLPELVATAVGPGNGDPKSEAFFGSVLASARSASHVPALK